MKARPDALGMDISVSSVEDVDHCLHEMAWLTSLQESIEAPSKAKIEAIKSEAQAKLAIEIEGQRCTIKQRWELLKSAVLQWCETQLKIHLPSGKKSLKLSHGELKTRKNEAAVHILDEKTESEVATTIAQAGQLFDSVDQLLSHELVFEGEKIGIPLCRLIAVQFALAKDPIKQEWARRPEVRELLRSLSISVEEQEQFTVSPARVQVATVEE